MGYHAMVLRYLTYTQGKKEFPYFMSNSLLLNEKTVHPAPVLDIGKATPFLRERVRNGALIWIKWLFKVSLQAVIIQPCMACIRISH